MEEGLYEAVVTDSLRVGIDGLIDGDTAVVVPLDMVEAPDRLALHLRREIQVALAAIPEARRVETGVAVARALMVQLAELIPEAGGGAAPSEPGELLRAVLGRNPDGTIKQIEWPKTPLLDTTLLTNAPGEPRLGIQIASEIASADAIDVVMAFIRRSGIRPMLEALRRHCGAGKPLRVLTTTYTGSTEQAALDQLREIGADVRISYDLSTTRLHAKAWLFRRRSGLSTAFVGSSNLTHSAQVTGLEWNVRVAEARNPDILGKVQGVYESYWSGGDFVDYLPEEFEEEQARVTQSSAGPIFMLSPLELRPEPFQERLLELIALARSRGHHRNLLVAATGTGKTVMAALDYLRLRDELSRARLLFVAHREEILDQSMATFRQALRDPGFGEKWVGSSRPRDFEHVFASIQSLHEARLVSLDPEHFDVVIVDEFHHAAAPSYERLLEHVEPRELLGLTATPERSDGLPVLHWFGDRVAAELRLWDAIDQHRLVPFMYFGVHDGLDLTDIPWKRGRGYDVEALSERYTSTDAWARLVVQETVRHADDITTMRCLGFCVSVDHAHFMAQQFTKHGLASVAVSGATSDADRRAALTDLAAGRLRAVFSVDLFNEGVDVPAVDTVLMLRPTESPTLFLQQLGRGLRRASGKSFCTVLDFVGTHRKEFRFDRKLRALLGGTRRDVESSVDDGFPYLPAGCHMQLDRKATEIVLQSLRSAIPSRWPAKVDELRSLRGAGRDFTLAEFLSESGLDLEDIYAGSKSWSDLRDAAGAPTAPAGPEEVSLRRAIRQLLHVDDRERLSWFRVALADDEAPVADALGQREQRLLRMLVAPLTDQALKKVKTPSLQDGADLLWRHPQVRSELVELLNVLDGRIDHLQSPLTTHPQVPLQVHGRYSRLEILAAFGHGDGGAKVISWQAGVLDLHNEDADLFAFTLDKTSGSFSPTTRYRDYAISRDLIHWESQSATREDSETGQRYQHHEAMGRSIMLFTRVRAGAEERAFWFLGPAMYVSHVGERPMAITWRLLHPLPGDLFANFAAAVA